MLGANPRGGEGCERHPFGLRLEEGSGPWWSGGLQPELRGQFGRPDACGQWAADRSAAVRRSCLGAELDLHPGLGLDHPISLAAPTAVS